MANRFLYRIFVIALCWLYDCPLLAQATGADTTIIVSPIPDLASPIANVKLHLLPLVDPFRSSIAVSTDLFPHKNFGIEVSAGYLFANWFQKYKHEKLSGFRGRLGLKYIFTTNDEIVTYIGLEGKMNWYYKTQWEQICRYGCQYNETFLTTKRIVTGGLSLKAGALFYVHKKRNVFFDLYGGIGYKRTQISYYLPEDAELLRNRSWLIGVNRNTGIYHLPDFLLGLNIGYAFYRKR